MSSRRTVTAVPLGANEDIGHVGYFKASIIDNTAQALKFDVILTFDDGPHHDIRLSRSDGVSIHFLFQNNPRALSKYFVFLNVFAAPSCNDTALLSTRRLALLSRSNAIGWNV